MREKVLSLSRRVMGSEHPDTIVAMINLASSYETANRRDQPLQMREEALQLEKELKGPPAANSAPQSP